MTLVLAIKVETSGSQFQNKHFFPHHKQAHTNGWLYKFPEQMVAGQKTPIVRGLAKPTPVLSLVSHYEKALTTELCV